MSRAESKRAAAAEQGGRATGLQGSRSHVRRVDAARVKEVKPCVKVETAPLVS